MQYGNEKTVAVKSESAEREKLSIVSPVVINGIPYEFSSRDIFKKFSITIPTNFEELSQELAVVKYPYSNRPQIIFSNPDTTVDIFFDCGKKKTSASLKDRVTTNKIVMEKLYRSYVFSAVKAGSQLGYFDFRSYTFDDDMYNLWFWMDLPDNTVFGGFSCPVRWQPQWQTPVLQMLQTIAILPVKSEV